MHSALAPKLPVWDGDELNFTKLGNILGAKQKELAQIINVSEATLRSPTVSRETLRKAQPLLYVLNLLWELTDGKSEEVYRWLNEPRIEWGGLSPLKTLTLGKLDAVKTLLERIYHGEISST